nr:hypothetical protein [Tanacetum cinerariifolium]
MTFEEVEAKFNSVCKQMKDFIPMSSKEEAERIKRKGINLEQESAKKQKSSEEITEEAKSSEKVPEEKVKVMMNLVPIDEVYVEALQVKHPIIDWKHMDREDLNQLWRLVKETLNTRPPTSDKEMELWVELSRLYEPDEADQLWTHTKNFMHAPVKWKLYDSYGVHPVAAKDKEIFMLGEKDYPLRKGLALMMICYKLQVENFSQMANKLVLKIYRIANSQRQQGTSKYWGVLRILMIGLRLIPLGEHNTDFHPMVDFIEASPLRYDLTVKPTVYVSHLRQFWSTAKIETTEEETKILATVDGIVRTVSESSLRRNLKLRDEEGISSLPDAKVFENLTLMGYNISPNQKFTFQKGQFSHQWKYLIHTI